MHTEMMLQIIRNGKNTSSVREFCMNVRYGTIFTIRSDTLILVLLSVLDDVTQLERSLLFELLHLLHQLPIWRILSFIQN
jgi:hypothetical protein